MKIQYLSYPITQSMPVYGGWGSLELMRVKAIDNGDSCNTWRFGMENHWGTHVDAPRHFFSNGRKVIDYSADFWIFNHPQVLIVQLEPGELLTWKTIVPQVDPSADLLLLKSGWGQHRNADLYWKRNPGIHSEVARELRNLGSALRAVGIDWISVSSFVQRADGNKTHQFFLSPDEKGEGILLIEDLDLSADLAGLSKVFVAPLRVEDLDSAPCTVMGLFND